MLRNWQIGLSERIDASRQRPLYLQIIQAVIRNIESERLVPGTYLPSTRELARMLGVNRKTVVLAYEDLIAQGWLTTAATRGTLVSETLPDSGSRTSGRATPEYRSAVRASPISCTRSCETGRVFGSQMGAWRSGCVSIRTSTWSRNEPQQQGFGLPLRDR